MSLSTVRLQPSMTFEQLVSSLNQNFAMFENLTVTQIFKDEEANQRILLGRFPDGIEWGLAITVKGVDVVKALGNG